MQRKRPFTLLEKNEETQDVIMKLGEDEVDSGMTKVLVLEKFVHAIHNKNKLDKANDTRLDTFCKYTSETLILQL